MSLTLEARRVSRVHRGPFARLVSLRAITETAKQQTAFETLLAERTAPPIRVRLSKPVRSRPSSIFSVLIVTPARFPGAEVRNRGITAQGPCVPPCRPLRDVPVKRKRVSNRPERFRKHGRIEELFMVKTRAVKFYLPRIAACVVYVPP